MALEICRSPLENSNGPLEDEGLQLLQHPTVQGLITYVKEFACMAMSELCRSMAKQTGTAVSPIVVGCQNIVAVLFVVIVGLTTVHNL